ncbi:MAG TPA: hypothetical protein VKY44_00865 [Flavobacterium sp.]|nr:hypothetical protein [Flavobacterium sp.]
MKKNTFLFWLFTLITFFSANTQAQTYKVNYQQNGFEGYIQFEIVKDSYLFGEPTFKIKNNVTNVITSYQNGNHNAVLSRQGITFPKTLNVRVANNGVNITGRAVFYMNTAKTVTHKSQPEISLSLYDPFPTAPDFSTEAEEYLKEYGKNHNVSLWKQTGELTNLRVKDVYFNDFRSEVEKIIREAERAQKEQELAEEKKQKEEQARKEQLAKGEADKKAATQTNAESKTTQDSQNTEGEKTVTGNSESEFKQTVDTGRSTQTTTSQNNTRDYQREWQETQERARRENERRRLQEERNKELGNELGKTIYDVTKDIEIKDGGNTTFLTYSIYTNQTFLGQLSFGTRAYAGEVFHLGIGVNLTHGSIEYWTSGNASQYSLSPVVGPGFQIGIGFGFREDLLGVREKHGDYEVFTFGITGAFDYLFDTGTETTTSTKNHHPLLSLRPNVSYNISKHFAVTLGYNIGINGNELFDEQALVFYTSPDKWEGEPTKGLKSIVVGLGFTW